MRSKIRLSGAGSESTEGLLVSGRVEPLPEPGRELGLELLAAAEPRELDRPRTSPCPLWLSWVSLVFRVWIGQERN